jgi:hypothetical protein
MPTVSAKGLSRSMLALQLLHMPAESTYARNGLHHECRFRRGFASDAFVLMILSAVLGSAIIRRSSRRLLSSLGLRRRSLRARNWMLTHEQGNSG